MNNVLRQPGLCFHPENIWTGTSDFSVPFLHLTATWLKCETFAKRKYSIAKETKDCYLCGMSLFVVYMTTQEQPKILRALKVVTEEDKFEFVVEAGENVVLPKTDIVCWEEFEDGQTAAILSREAVMAKRAAAMSTPWEEDTTSSAH